MPGTNISNNRPLQNLDGKKKMSSEDNSKSKEIATTSDMLHMVSRELTKAGLDSKKAATFMDHPVTKKVVSQYAASNKTLVKGMLMKGAIGAPGFGLMAAIMITFAKVQTRLNNKVAMLTAKQAEINKTMGYITQVLQELNSSDPRGHRIKIPPGLKQYIKDHGPSSVVGENGKTLNESLYDYIFDQGNSFPGQLEVSSKNIPAMLKVFSGFQTNLTSNNTIKTQLQSATQKNLNFTKEMGTLISTVYTMLKTNVAKL